MLNGPKGERVRPVVDCSKDKVRTRQEFKDQCDINKIVARATNGVATSNLVVRQGVFADVSEIGDYMDVLNRVKAVESLFSALPSEIRKRFENDPAGFLEAWQNDSDGSLHRELGFILVDADGRPVADALDTVAPAPTPVTPPEGA